MSTKFERSYSVVPHGKKLVTNRIKRKIYHQYTCTYCNSVYLGNSHPRMLNTTWNRGTIVDKLSRYTIRPNGSKIYSNLLRTRECFTTSHMHIYSIPPMSRMNFAQKRVPKLFCSDFIPVFSFSVVTTFFGNDNQLPNFFNSNTVFKYQIEERSM